MNFYSLFSQLLVQILGTAIIFTAVITLGIYFLKRKRKYLLSGIAIGIIGLGLILFSGRAYVGWYLFEPQMDTFGPDAHAVFPAISNIVKFFLHFNQFEKVANIAQDPNNIPPPLTRTTNTTVHYTLEANEVVSNVAPGVFYNYWTYNGKVPGPFLRVLQGDTVVITLKNNKSSLHTHSIDLHAVNGPGGGAITMQVSPGQEKTFSFVAENPGLYVYHCASHNPAPHMTHGQFGLILVEPKGRLPKVDKEFYAVQSELYTYGNLNDKGLQLFDGNSMLNEHPQYIIFNGKVNALSNNMQAKVGDKIRIYVGNAGVSYVSSFHVIGEIFDTVYPEGAIGPDSALLHNVQTTTIPAGGAAIVEFTAEKPGNYMLVDHALSRMERGASGMLMVSSSSSK